MLGNGDGTSQTAVNYSPGTPAQSVAVGDFNADAKPDMALANSASGTVSPSTAARMAAATATFVIPFARRIVELLGG